jgi:hypothetical protein
LAAAGSYVTASVTPTSGALVLLFAYLGSTIADPTSVSGCGLTWAKVASVAWNSGAVPIDMLICYKGTGTPSAGAISVQVADNTTSGGWNVVQVTGQHATTPIVQSAVDTSDAEATTQPALAAFGHADNWTILGGVVDTTTGTLSFEGDYTQIGTTEAGESKMIAVAYKQGNDTTPTMTYSSALRDVASIALELAPAAGGGGGTANPWYAFQQQ